MYEDYDNFLERYYERGTMADRADFLKLATGAYRTHNNLDIIYGYIQNVVKDNHVFLYALGLWNDGFSTIYNTRRPLSHKTKPGWIFSKEVRDLARVRECCCQKMITKTNQKCLGELSALVKLYNYDFTNVYKAMFPNDDLDILTKGVKNVR